MSATHPQRQSTGVPHAKGHRSPRTATPDRLAYVGRREPRRRSAIAGPGAHDRVLLALQRRHRGPHPAGASPGQRLEQRALADESGGACAGIQGLVVTPTTRWVSVRM